jgi:glucose/arabinose dehydrogenase
MRGLLVAAATAGALVGETLAQAPAVPPFPASCSGVPAARFPYTLNPAWKVTKVGTGLTQPRTIVFDSAGNMLVLQSTKGLSVSTFAADGCLGTTTMLVSDRALNHGLALSPDGKKLYASGETTAWSWDYDAATKTLSNKKVIVKGMSTGIHSTRTLQVSPKNPNLVLVSVGSNANFDMQTIVPATGRSTVKVFDVSKTPEGGYSYNTQGKFLGYGMRNEIGLAFDPNGMVWGVENSGDVSPTPPRPLLLAPGGT